MGSVILTIDDIAPDRPRVAIKGKEYELRVLDDFGLRDNALMRKRGQSALEALADVRDLSDERLATFESDLDYIVSNSLIGITETEVRRLSWKEKTRVLTAFFRTIVGSLAPATEALPSTESPTGESYLPASSDATEATP